MKQTVIQVFDIVWDGAVQTPEKLKALYLKWHTFLSEIIGKYPKATALFLEILLLVFVLCCIKRYFTRPVATQPEVEKLTKIDVKMVTDKKNGIIAIGLLVVALIAAAWLTN